MPKRGNSTLRLLSGAIALAAACGASDFRYCDVPLKLPDNPIAAERGLELFQLQVVIRHGDRTPTARLPDDAVPAVSWECEEFAHTLRYLEGGPQAVEQEVIGPFFFPPSCSKGQLTSRGRDQHLALGGAMREKYVSRLRFLPPTLNHGNQDQFFFRSTDYPRTRQSGQAFLAGLYPAWHRIGTPEVILRIRDVDDMNLNTEACAALRKEDYLASPVFDELFANNLDAVRAIGRKLGTWKASQGGEEARFLATISASDNLFGRVCHGKGLPQQIDLKDVETMRGVANQYLAGAFTYGPKATRLGIGPFLKGIWERMQDSAGGRPVAQMTLYSGHDVTLWGLLAALSDDNRVLIPYASHMAFELWRDGDGRFWVGVEFNGHYRTDVCGSSLCSLEKFEERIAEFIPGDYREECRVD